MGQLDTLHFALRLAKLLLLLLGSWRAAAGFPPPNHGLVSGMSL